MATGLMTFFVYLVAGRHNSIVPDIGLPEFAIWPAVKESVRVCVEEEEKDQGDYRPLGSDFHHVLPPPL